MNYYNDSDQKICAWLRELIKSGLIPDGHVDDRSISDVRAQDLAGFSQCHFFAGIGGWPADAAVWTGSCPCQPLSVAGKRRGHEDDRHLWPVWFRLIEECRPPVVFGEQVASRDGREWLCGVRADLESLEYAVGAADLCAAGVSAPHIRQRLFWVAKCDSTGWDEYAQSHSQEEQSNLQSSRRPDTCGCGGNGGMGHSESGRREEQRVRESAGQARACPECTGFWSDARWLWCRDGKYRRVPAESALFPLAPRLPGRVGLLRGAGNAIVPQVAAAFVRAAMIFLKH